MQESEGDDEIIFVYGGNGSCDSSVGVSAKEGNGCPGASLGTVFGGQKLVMAVRLALALSMINLRRGDPGYRLSFLLLSRNHESCRGSSLILANLDES